MRDTSDFEYVLETCRRGEPGSFDRLVDLTYAELRSLARSVMRARKPGTLQPTALVNEAYLRLIGGDTSFESRAHFFGAAARAMRQVLVGYARSRGALKRAGQARRITVAEFDVPVDEPALDVLLVNEALLRLEAQDPGLCRLLELRYFAGFGLEEASQILGISMAAAKRDWAYARAWLFDYLGHKRQ